ncbi:MAG: 16S rRNA (cytosine(1402)-N(4))-methyltransferase RsmH [Phycisphaerales bacterium]|jgi:16S rRNA (cytosine1402-N4)-methyltransferase|nr:16S rRNA (cytosine(1402)-N(4))-methyltransferase RsmH [Phycisphaerales bacterium]MDP6311998.1 16S rRNA (cytosine(1402)-N(4))-methyltransferase RsmH [Phycisphaerales bacterium]MDP7188257.1 16S rRNA (cytosine(1402)-N(4))-methyltransferase RsmH [Phycisphaerales bacterium]MDP7520039.1 16S rRNA (cytosine(1402)-N(4))-methyltransferase RsmH [Phycisphaerales bacterium]HCA39712.1 16S rRNA (cytosine(1402)-N(4))-methyltransferase [Phycisphaerales bacterium]|tara:strand:+ start:5100 stop:6020 length:921 start_codon:yes stop_codon:yes gene_type:complete
MTTPPNHHPVLLDEVVTLLAPQPGDVILDCTLGRGGHSAALAGAADNTTVVGMDLDETNLAFADARLREAGITCHSTHGNFVRAPETLQGAGLAADIVLADLGFASNQVDDPTRGFSFRHDGPLDMRLDPTGPITAASLLASLPERDLAELIARHGEEPLAARIAQKVAQERSQRPIHTTGQLADLVREAYGVRARTSRQHPATRTFQALRIAVNDELAALQTLLDRLTRALQADDTSWLRLGARIGIIAFHSLEDRPVKQCFTKLVRNGLASDVSAGAVRAGQEEQDRNPRSRSARLRVVRSTIE